MPHMNRLDYQGWYYCPAHHDMELWKLGSCVARVMAVLWDEYVTFTNDSLVNGKRHLKSLKLSSEYPVIEHGPDPIFIR